MKYVAKTVAENVGFGIEIDEVVGGIELTLITRGDKRIKTLINKEYVKNALGKGDLVECSNLYLVYDESVPSGFVIRNKMEETFDSKAGGSVFITRMGRSIIGQIYIPFADSPFSEWSLRVNYDPEKTCVINGSYALEIVDNNSDSFTTFFDKCLPGISASSINPIDGGYEVTVRPTQEGVDVVRSGVRIFVKGPVGYFPKREVVTGADGTATFKVMTRDLESSDEVIAEFGYKFMSNLLSVKLQ